MSKKIFLLLNLFLLVLLSCKENLPTKVDETLIYDEYFPLNIGQKWEYEYTHSSYAGSIPGGYSFSKSSGILYWEVITKNEEENNYKYTFTQKDYDSLTNQTKIVDNFCIYENKSTGELRFTTNLMFSAIDSIPNYGRVKRYYPKGTETVLYFSGYDYASFSLQLSKEKGINSYHSGYSGITFGHSHNFKLKE